MPLNKSTTYHQSVQFFVQFFSKKNCLFSEQKKKLKKNFTQFYLKSTHFYHILLSFTSSGTQFYQIPTVVLLHSLAARVHCTACEFLVRQHWTLQYLHACS